MKSPKLWLLASLSVLLFFTACQPAGQKANDKKLSIDYEEYQLKNGLDVILHQDDSDPIVAVAILFHVGSNREKPGRTGFAHFFEHMLFQNSENVGKGQFFKTINELGGDFNGGTWNDGTVYYEVVPKDALEKIMWMESDRMGFMINTVTDPVFQNEKQVVKNEKRERIDNQPYGHTDYVIGKNLYPESHPYNWQVIGSLEDLDAATLDDVKEFYETYYGPNNATMVIAGDFNKAEAKEMIEKYFGEIQPKEEITPPQPQPVTLEHTIKLMYEDKFAQLPELRMVWPTVEDGHADMYALDYLGELLSDGKRAPLFKEVVENQKLAPSTASYNRAMELAGEFHIQVRASAGKDLDDVEAAIFKALQQFEENGIDDRDMERIKNTLETQFYSGISSLLYKSFQLAQFKVFRGDTEELSKEVDRILGVTKEDVMRVYEKYIKDKPYVATAFVPAGQAELALEGAQVAEVVEEDIVPGAEPAPLPEDEMDFEKTPSKIDRTIVPPLGAPPVVNTPDIWDVELSNGLKVFGIQNNELPLVEFSLRIKGGMLLDDPQKIGVANLITDLMQEGTATKTPEQLEDAIGQLGADISMYTSPEYITITGSCLARNYDALMAIFEEMLLQPRWDEKEFDRLKASTITQIQQRNGQPNIIANRIFAKMIYGKDHILANSTFGTQESVQSITIDDLKAYYEKNFSPTISSFHVVGAVNKDKVMTSLISLEQNWKSKDVAIPEQPAGVTPDAPKVYFVDIPGSSQSVIRIGAPSVKGSDPDFYKIQVVNDRLGAGSNGRLFQQLREERGYTYGAYSSVPRRISPSFFVASSGVRSNVTKESVQLFDEILSGYKEDYTAEDLDKTKVALVKGNALAFETLGDKLGILHNISTYDLPKDYIEQNEKTLQAMTLDEAKGLIEKYINSDQMIFTIVGDAATQADRVKELGIGEFYLIDKDGEVVKEVAN